MKRWQQLRWQILGSYLIVVVVGVSSLLLASRFIFLDNVGSTIRPMLAAMAPAVPAEELDRVAAQVALSFRDGLVISLLVAALAAALVGILMGYRLLRNILRPLDQVVVASQRVANGRYDERLPLPQSSELARVAANFNQMAEALEHIEDRRVALIGNVAHELRTPLSALQGYTEGLIDGLFPPTTETFDAMNRDLGRLRRLVSDLQELSRVEAGQIELTLAPLDVAEVAEQVFRQLRPQALDLELSLAVAPGTDPRVVADRDRVAQILINLVGNAIRHTPAGGAVHIDIERRGRQMAVAVRDSGQGIPPDALPFLFERFYRVDVSRSRSSGGSGIGLTISRHLAWAMGGDVSAASPGQGQGSTFTLTLPAA